MKFPSDIRLNQADRKQQLLQWFYEKHHENRKYDEAKDDNKKLNFYQEYLENNKCSIDLGIDLGCRAGALTKHLKPYGNWVGTDIDSCAIKLAEENGIPCIQSDISIALDFKDDVFDAVLLTEVLEHLPYPMITIKEVHRILKKNEKSVFMGSVPIDYHFHRRFAVFRGKRLTMDPTHLHSFSYKELKIMLEHFFHHVSFKPMRGTKTRHAWLPWDHFVRDIAWIAGSPKKKVGDLKIEVIE